MPPIAADKTNDTATLNDHAAHHNELANAVNAHELRHQVFVQPNAPTVTGPYLWVQTGIGPDSDTTFWIEDGA